MKCPFCKSKLVPGELRHFENLTDHVSNPNRVHYPLRPTFVCKNKTCEMSANSFWDAQGGWYAGGVADVSETTAIGSWDRWYNNQYKFSKKISSLLFFINGWKQKRLWSRAITSAIYRWSEPPYHGE